MNYKIKKRILSVTFNFESNGNTWRVSVPSACRCGIPLVTYEQYFRDNYATCVYQVSKAYIIAENLQFEFAGYLYTWQRDKYHNIIFRVYDIAGYKVAPADDDTEQDTKQRRKAQKALKRKLSIEHENH